EHDMTDAVQKVELEGLGEWRRSHTCGEVSRASTSQQAILMGWVHRVRDHGGGLFIDLPERFRLTQGGFRPEIVAPWLLAQAGQAGNEWVIAVHGPIVLRPLDSFNEELPTGQVEMQAHALKILASADPLPFNVNEEMHLANEDLRLRYRYLDLRRPEFART